MERKRHKRHRDRSESESGSHRKKHHKHHHERNDQHSSDEDQRKHERKKRRHGEHNRDRDRDFDPNIRIKQEQDDENFQRQQRERSHHDRQRREHRRQHDLEEGGLLNLNSEVKSEAAAEDNTKEEKQKPNFELSGKLTEDTNTFRGVVIKYNEPPEAMKPKRKWRLYPFKGETPLPVLHIHRQSAFLLGRDRRIADIPVDHPSCSKQQAVLQFRAVPYQRPDGTAGRRVRPYVIDLESANGTYLNGDRMDPRRYYELKEKDMIKFGFSTREYVILHDSVDTSELNEGEDIEEM